MHWSKVRPWQERFWEHVRKGDGDACWEWTGSRYTRGYGRLLVGQQRLSAHRISWELHHGPVPEGLSVLHRCDNPPCVRPDHLFLGDAADNAADKEAKNRGNHAHGERHGLSKFTRADVIGIRYAVALAGCQQRALAGAYGVGQAAIAKIIKRRTWRNV